MRRAVILCLSLAACAPQPLAPPSPIEVLRAGELRAVNLSLGLYTYPRAVIFLTEADGYRTRHIFASPVLPYSVFSHFHYQLVGQGWQQQWLHHDQERYEARYRRRGQQLWVRLRREDNRYTLETR